MLSLALPPQTTTTQRQCNRYTNQNFHKTHAKEIFATSIHDIPSHASKRQLWISAIFLRVRTVLQTTTFTTTNEYKKYQIIIITTPQAQAIFTSNITISRVTQEVSLPASGYGNHSDSNSTMADDGIGRPWPPWRMEGMACRTIVQCPFMVI